MPLPGITDPNNRVTPGICHSHVPSAASAVLVDCAGHEGCHGAFGTPQFPRKPGGDVSWLGRDETLKGCEEAMQFSIPCGHVV